MFSTSHFNGYRTTGDAMKFCGECSSRAGTGRFCSECGLELISHKLFHLRECQKCGAFFQRNANYCTDCGIALGEIKERVIPTKPKTKICGHCGGSGYCRKESFRITGAEYSCKECRGVNHWVYKCSYCKGKGSVISKSW